MKNSTGKRSGCYIRYEFGADLFGDLFIDIIYGKWHKMRISKRLIFDNARDFIFKLDDELWHKENLNYVRD